MAKKLKVPSGQMLPYLMDNPNAIPEAIKAINALLSIETRVVAGTAFVQGRSPATVSDTNVVIPIPVGFSVKVSPVATYAADTFGATYNATVRSQLATLSSQVATLTTAYNNLILALQQANINPR